MPQNATMEGFAGVGLIAVWAALQYLESTSSGYIHLLLGLGVVLVVRGIVTSEWGSPPPR
jgi:hypothetical protein